MRSDRLAAAVKDLGKKLEAVSIEVAFSEEGYKKLFERAEHPVLGV